MKTDSLKELGLSDEQIKFVMAENGKDIENVKTKFADYEDLKTQLSQANEKISSFGELDSMDKINAEINKWKLEAENLKTESEKKIAKMELQAKIKEFTGSKTFVNDLTRDAINSKLETALEDESAKGKSIDEIFATVTDGMTNILVDANAPKPPVMAEPQGNTPKTESGLEAAFRRLNPTLKIE